MHKCSHSLKPCDIRLVSFANSYGSFFFLFSFFFFVLVCVVVVLAARGGWKTVPLGVLCMFPSGIYRKSDASVRARVCFLHFWHRGRFSVLELAGWALGTAWHCLALSRENYGGLLSDRCYCLPRKNMLLL